MGAPRGLYENTEMHITTCPPESTHSASLASVCFVPGRIEKVAEISENRADLSHLLSLS